MVHRVVWIVIRRGIATPILWVMDKHVRLFASRYGEILPFYQLQHAVAWTTFKDVYCIRLILEGCTCHLVSVIPTERWIGTEKKHRCCHPTYCTNLGTITRFHQKRRKICRMARVSINVKICCIYFWKANPLTCKIRDIIIRIYRYHFIPARHVPIKIIRIGILHPRLPIHTNRPQRSTQNRQHQNSDKNIVLHNLFYFIMSNEIN